MGRILKLFCQHIISVRIRGGAETQLNFTLFIPSILSFTLKISNAHLTTVQDIDIIFGFEGRKINLNPKNNVYPPAPGLVHNNHIKSHHSVDPVYYQSQSGSVNELSRSAPASFNQKVNKEWWK